jgi:hypothetical protein
MNTVLYTEDLEPITVVDLPMWIWERLKIGHKMNLPVIEPLQFTPPKDNYPPEFLRPKIVTIWAEKFVYRDKTSLFVFTRDDENALQLKADFLPGQRGEVQRREQMARIQGFFGGLSQNIA